MAKRKKAEQGPAYKFRGEGSDFFAYQGPECVISGPAGSGKSVLALTKLFLCCDNLPKLRVLMVRKTRESLTESALVTFEQKVVPPGNFCLAAGGIRRVRQSYNFHNGSVIVLGGMDNVTKVMSAEYDIVYCQEATELKEEDWEALSSRLRNNRMSYQQIMADCNPDSPNHWLKKRCEAGKCKMFFSKHEDNPFLFDEQTGDWTEEGRTYISRLDALSGVRLQRLRYGRWVQAEGAVFENFSEEMHVLERDAKDRSWGRYPPAEWERFIGIDFGYTNPFAAGFFARDPDGRLVMYNEIYHTKKIVEEHAARIKAMLNTEARVLSMQMRQPYDTVRRMISPRAIICDHDAEDRATLTAHLGIATVPAIKEVHPGIEAVITALAPAGDGKPRLYFMRDVLDQRDQNLVDLKKPTCFLEEVGGYVWNTEKDKPVKIDDHCVDVVRYVTIYCNPVQRIIVPPEVMSGEKRSIRPGVMAEGRFRFGQSDRWKGSARLFRRG